MINRANYKIVQLYKCHQLQVKQNSPASVTRYLSDLRHFMLWADDIPYNRISTRQPTFADYLSNQTSLTPTTAAKVIQSVRAFLTWGKLYHPRDFAKVSATWIADLRAPRHVEQRPRREFVTLDEVRQLLAIPGAENDIALLRDQAAAAMLFVSGMRASALGSLPIAAVQLSELSVKQWPELGVKTKDGKRATTYLLPIDDLLAVIKEWDAYIRARLPDTAMWFTPFRSEWGELHLCDGPAGACRNQALADRMALLSKRANIPVKSPHEFRHGHAVYGIQRIRTMADYKALSQNLMHGDIKVTDSIYAVLTTDEVKLRISQIPEHAENTQSDISDPELANLLRQLPRQKQADAIQLLARLLAT